MPVTELRVEVDSSEVAVLDGYCSATGKHRSEVIRLLLREWSNAKHYEATRDPSCRRMQSNHPGREQEMIGTSALAIIVIALAGAIIAVLGYAMSVVRETADFDISNVGSEE